MISEADRGIVVATAAYNGHLEIVLVLLENGANHQGDRGKAVREAVYGGHLEIVRALLANQAVIYF